MAGEGSKFGESGAVGALMLWAGAVATFIDVCGWEGWKVQWSACSHEIQSSKHTEPTVPITQK